MSKDDYQEYLKQKHSKHSVSQNLLNRVVQKATDQEVLDYHRVIAGEVNEVYRVQTKNRKIIVRISRRKEDTFTPEKWAIDEARKHSVPVPEILLLEKAEDEGRVVRICVENEILGDSLSQISGDLPEKDIKGFIFEAGIILGKIHSVNPIGFGNLRGKGIGEDEAWEAYI